MEHKTLIDFILIYNIGLDVKKNLIINFWFS